MFSAWIAIGAGSYVLRMMEYRSYRSRHDLFTRFQSRLGQALGLQHRDGRFAVVDIVMGVGLPLHQQDE